MTHIARELVDLIDIIDSFEYLDSRYDGCHMVLYYSNALQYTASIHTDMVCGILIINISDSSNQFLYIVTSCFLL